MEYEHVKAKSCPGKCVHHGSIERLFVGEHPGVLRHGEGEVVLVPEPEEDVLEGGAASLVSFSESHLHNSRHRKIIHVERINIQDVKNRWISVLRGLRGFRGLKSINVREMIP